MTYDWSAYFESAEEVFDEIQQYTNAWFDFITLSDELSEDQLKRIRLEHDCIDIDLSKFQESLDDEVLNNADIIKRIPNFLRVLAFSGKAAETDKAIHELARMLALGISIVPPDASKEARIAFRLQPLLGFLRKHCIDNSPILESCGLALEDQDAPE